MRLQQITSLIFLGLAALSSCQPVENHQEVRTVSKAKAPTCKKATMFHRIAPPKPGTKLPAKKTKSLGGKCKRKRSDIFNDETSTIGNTDKISEISKRAVITFEMNGPAQWAPLTRAGDALHTHSLGGCSVVAIFSKTFAVGVHVSQGTYGQDDQASTARDAMSKLMSLYRAKADRTQPVKALVFTADLGNDNRAANEFLAALEKARMGNVAKWILYDHEQFCALENPLTQATVDISWAGAGQWPQVTAGGECLSMD